MSDEIRYLLDRAASNHISRRTFIGRAGALGLSAVAANSMLATAVRAQGPVKGGTFRIGMLGGSTTDSLDPGLSLSQVTFQIGRLYGETLLDATPEGGLAMKLADSVESTPDAKKWTFHIRQGVQFHNGKTLTPEDVQATLTRHSDKNSNSAAYSLLQGIESVSIDGENVVITLTAGNADLPYLMADNHLVIQPGGGRENPADGIGTGAYRLLVNEPGIRHVFEKFAGYWDDSVGHFENVEILVINDNTARNTALQSGQVHLINQIDPKVAGLVSRVPGVVLDSLPSRGHYVFVMHSNTAPFDNKDLRLALKYAINRQEMVDKILMGYGTIGNDIPINAAYPLFDSSLPQRAYDPDKAAFHYRASGHDGTPIVLRTSEVAFPNAVDAAQLFQQSAKAAGIPLEIRREPADGYWSNVWNVQPFVASYWVGYPVQDQMYSLAYLSTADWNETRFNNAEFDSLLIAARAELVQAKRAEMYARMAAILHEDGGLICPMFNNFLTARSDRLQGWINDPNRELMNGYSPHKCWLA